MDSNSNQSSLNHENLLKILSGRDQRAERQQQLIGQYGQPLVSFTLNIPGPNKVAPEFERIHQLGIDSLEKAIHEISAEIIYREISVNAAGNQGFFIIDADALAIKKLTVGIEENHRLGRLFDFDVFDTEMNQVNRSTLGLGERSCLICDDKAAICKRSRKHSIAELLATIDSLILESN